MARRTRRFPKERDEGMKKGEAKQIAIDVVFDVAGCFISALGTQVFNAPNSIAPGGVTGVSILLNYLFGLPISIVTLAINIPLLIVAYFLLGRRITLRTFRTVLIMTAMLALINAHIPVYQGEEMLAALYGGVLSGVGLALVFMRASTTGGTDIIARIIQKKFPDLAVGRLLLILDAFVLVAAALVYRNIESALFAMVGIFTRTRVLDSILYGLDTGKVMMIVSARYEELARAINAKIRRGCTLLDAKGTYTMQERPMLFCVVRKSQYYELKRLINSVDPEAFTIAMEANEIIGKGFKHHAVG